MDTSLDASTRARALPRRRKGSGPLGLEVRLFWGDQRVGDYFLHPGKALAFSVGSGPDVDFAMGSSRLGGPRFEAIRADAQGFVLQFSRKMKGELHRGGEVMDLGKATGGCVSLKRNDFAWVDLGGIVLEVSFQPVPKTVVVPLTERLDFTALNSFLMMAFLGALFVISALNRGLEGEAYPDELSGNPARIVRLMPRPPASRTLDPLARKKEGPSEAAAKHRDAEGKMGQKDAPQRTSQAAPRGDPKDDDQTRRLVRKIFGSEGYAVSTLFGQKGLGGPLKAAMGNLLGLTQGDAKGFGGLGLRGTASGGGDLGDSVGIGVIGTHGRAGGADTYGDRAGVLTPRKEEVLPLTPPDTLVTSLLDKDLIRRVIHAHRDQVRYCYETQLIRFPNLDGKVTVKFVITGSGAVASSLVAESTADNAELERCVATHVRSWQFPKPKGGGTVTVTYPFLFKRSGE